jgi:hypothetical protein
MDVMQPHLNQSRETARLFSSELEAAVATRAGKSPDRIGGRHLKLDR